MSRTQQKNGMTVQDACRAFAEPRPGYTVAWFTVGEVAKKSGKSKPTCQKYINMLVKAGVVKEQERDMRYCTRLTARCYQWIGLAEE